MCLVRKFLVHRREIAGSETFLMLTLSEKKSILYENITPAFYLWRESVATYWENWESLFSS